MGGSAPVLIGPGGRTFRPALPLVFLLLGATAVIAQILFLRELVVVFNGNEASLGLVLAAWLLWTALGAGPLAGLVCGRAAPRRLAAALEAAVAFALPATLAAVRAGRLPFERVPGELLGPAPMLLLSFAVLGLFCALSGCLFAAASLLVARVTGAPSAHATGTVYLYEALGAAAGGILAGVALLAGFGSFPIALTLAALNLAAAAFLCGVPKLCWIPLAALPLLAPALESLSLSWLWRGSLVVASRNSQYGNLAVLDTGGTRSLYANGQVLFHAPDPASAEESVHLALLQHPAPRTLLLIGGGAGGSLAEALKHPTLQRADYAELDPAILELASRYFPGSLHAGPRVRLHAADGRLFLKQSTGLYDVILVSLPDPSTAQLNRFFTLEFFREASRRLATGGLLSFHLSGAENYISPQRAAFLRSIHKTLRAVFPAVTVFPGDTIHFFAAGPGAALTSSASELAGRLRARALQTTYIREYYLPFRLSPDRMAALDEQVRPLPETPLNRDFAPVAYFFSATLWSTQFRPGRRSWLEALAGLDFRALAAAAVLLPLAVLLVPGSRVRLSAGLSTAAMGFTLIGLELMLLLGFQAVHGYVYHQLAAIITAFMAGMALGSWCSVRVGRLAGRALAATQALVGLSPLLVCAALFAHPAPLAFPLLALFCGAVGGFQFPLASRVYFQAAGACPAAIGTPYALDLAGSCLGALVFSAWLIPVYGFWNTALLAALLNLAPALLTALASRS